jgi:hypothetical protein
MKGGGEGNIINFVLFYTDHAGSCANDLMIQQHALYSVHSLLYCFPGYVGDLFAALFS